MRARNCSDCSLAILCRAYFGARNFVTEPHSPTRYKLIQTSSGEFGPTRSGPRYPRSAYGI